MLWQCVAAVYDDVCSCHVRTAIASKENKGLELHKVSFFDFGDIVIVIVLTLLSSAALQIRLPGIMASHCAISSSGCLVNTTAQSQKLCSKGQSEFDLLSVIINPGEIQLTLAKSAHSTARLLARWTAAALDAL